MKKKVLIISISVALLMLSMPVISNIQAQPATTPEIKEPDDCNICLARELIKNYANSDPNAKSGLWIFRPGCVIVFALAVLCSFTPGLWDLYWSLYLFGDWVLNCWTVTMP